MNKENTNKRSLKYCCICKGIFRGKIIDGRKISLHRFPQNKRLRRVWIQRCKTVNNKFVYSENRLLCSEHFVDLRGPTPFHTVPSLFPTQSGTQKIFATSTLSENEPTVELDDEEIPDEVFKATLLTDLGSSDIDADTPEHVYQSAQNSYIDVSLHLHDYCNGPPLVSSFYRNMETQTHPFTVSEGSQTELSLTKQI